MIQLRTKTAAFVAVATLLVLLAGSDRLRAQRGLKNIPKPDVEKELASLKVPAPDIDRQPAATAAVVPAPTGRP